MRQSKTTFDFSLHTNFLSIVIIYIYFQTINIRFFFLCTQNKSPIRYVKMLYFHRYARYTIFVLVYEGRIQSLEVLNRKALIQISDSALYGVIFQI